MQRSGMSRYQALFINRTKFSAAPFEHGSRGAVRRCRRPVQSRIHFNSAAQNFHSLLVASNRAIRSGRKHFLSASITNDAFGIRVANNSDHLEYKTLNTNQQYRLRMDHGNLYVHHPIQRNILTKFKLHVLRYTSLVTTLCKLNLNRQILNRIERTDISATGVFSLLTVAQFVS